METFSVTVKASDMGQPIVNKSYGADLKEAEKVARQWLDLGYSVRLTRQSWTANGWVDRDIPVGSEPDPCPECGSVALSVDGPGTCPECGHIQEGENPFPGTDDEPGICRECGSTFALGHSSGCSYDDGLTLNESVLADNLQSILEDANEVYGTDGRLLGTVRMVETFGQRGLLTRDAGLVLTMADGTEFELAITARRSRW